MTRASTAFLFALISACASPTKGPDFVGDPPSEPSDPTDPDPTDPDDPTDPPVASTVTVTLAANNVSGSQRVNFAVPLPVGTLSDPASLRVLAGGTELAAGRRVLASYPDGSARSVQLQVDVDVATTSSLEVRLGEPSTTTDLALVPVAQTLVAADGTLGPKVWARLPASWLSTSRVAGPQLPEADTTGALAHAWDNVCEYGSDGVDAFLAQQTAKDIWLYDRGTAFYRAYARRGDQTTLESGYRETAIYRARLTGTGIATRIGVPDAADDLKYHYSQNLAIHYLLTGDDRFRDAAEDVADRIHALWTSPGYAGGADFWTERHAGFALLAYVWTAMVSDNRAADFAVLADQAFDAYAQVESDFAAWPDAASRCFAHTAEAHGEDFGTWGCSPWMSAILADGLDAYAWERTGSRRDAARAEIVSLGTMIARHGLDGDGRPVYWLALDGSSELDDYDEHWGEPAYVAAMAWHWGGRTDSALRATVDDLISGLAANGSAPHLRSFNWQCRSAIAAPWYLRP